MSIIPKYRKYAIVAYKSTLSENNDFHLLTGRKPTSIGGSPECSNLSCYANKDCCSINSRSVSIMKYSLSSILRTSCTSMAFAVWSALSSKESFTLQSAVTDIASEAFRMPVSLQSLDPSVSGLDRKLTTSAFSLEQPLPIIEAVWVSILHMEGSSADWYLTFATDKALLVPGLLQSSYCVTHDREPTLGTSRSKVSLIVLLTVDFVV